MKAEKIQQLIDSRGEGLEGMRTPDMWADEWKTCNTGVWNFEDFIRAIQTDAIANCKNDTAMPEEFIGEAESLEKAEPREHIHITIEYRDDSDSPPCERLQHSVYFDGVPSQSKVWDRVKEMVDILYSQVRREEPENDLRSYERENPRRNS